MPNKLSKFHLAMSVGVFGHFCNRSFPPKRLLLKCYLARTPNFPSSFPSLVCLANVHCIYNSNVPFIYKEYVI